jgi:simple sugar transport system substrate-binding protein
MLFRRTHPRGWSWAIVALFLTAFVFSTDSGISAKAEDKPVTIYFVGIVSPGDPFHGIIARGAERAGKDLGAKVVYIFPDKVTLSDYNDKIEQAIAAKPDGIVILGIDEKGSEPLAQRAHELGIKLAFNPAPPIKERPLWSKDDLYISRVGSDEYSAGRAAGERLVKAGVKGKVVCAIQIPGDTTLSTRCKGVTDRLKEAGIGVDVIEIANEPGQSAELLGTYLRVHTDVGAVVTLGGPPNAGSREAKKFVGRTDLLLGAFDLDMATLVSIKAGEMLFTVDQQPYWRGYIPVLELVHNIRYGLQQANYFLSGPTIIDSDNVDQVIDMAKQGVR